MKKIKEFVQLEGENVLTQIEGDAYNDNPNPLAQLLMAIVRIIWMICGVKLRTYLVVTNLRIVLIEKKTILWGMLPGAVTVTTLNKYTISSVGYAMASSWFIFRKHYFLLANAANFLRLTYKGKAEDLHNSCRIIDEIVAKR